MKKIIALLTIVGCIASTSVMAQGFGGGQQMDPAQMLEMMKQRMKPQLIEKTKLSDAEADKVLEIQLWAQSQNRGLRDLSDDERAAKQKETAEERKKKMKEFNYKFNNAKIDDIEREPAYKRQGVDLDEVQHSSEFNTSRISVGLDDNDDIQLRNNNSFLHDNVD
mgnify:CR=1 FL=1